MFEPLAMFILYVYYALSLFVHVLLQCRAIHICPAHNFQREIYDQKKMRQTARKTGRYSTELKTSSSKSLLYSCNGFASMCCRTNRYKKWRLKVTTTCVQSATGHDHFLQTHHCQDHPTPLNRLYLLVTK